MKQHTSEEIQAILQEKKAGATLKELAAKHGVGVSTISTWNKRFGANGKAKPKRKTAKKATKPVDKMDKLKAELKKLESRKEEIKSEMTKLFFERLMGEF